ncbi:MAG TPA: hypothetical protein VKY41_07020 [Xanthomarina sp.]|nr:hypothetical protein [Xanthomarina sp.]
MMKNTLLILLVLIAIGMIVLGVQSEILPPILTGIGFVIISVLLAKKK